MSDSRPVVVRGHNAFTGTSSADGSPQQTFPLHPDSLQSGRLVDFVECFECFKALRIRIHFCLAGNGANIGVAYRPGLSIDTPPSSFAHIVDTDCFAMSYPGLTTPRVLNVPVSEAKGEKEWYSTSDNTDVPGHFWVSVLSAATNAATSQVFFLFVEWEFAFYGPVNRAVTLDRMRTQLRKEIVVELIEDEKDFPPAKAVRTSSLRLPKSAQ